MRAVQLCVPCVYVCAIGLFTSMKTWPPEVDFAETIGRQGSTLFLTQHFAGEAGQHSMAGETVEAWVDTLWSDAYHVYALEWTPGLLVYFVDGVEVLRQPVRFNETEGPGLVGFMDVSIGLATGDCGGFVGCPEEAVQHGFPEPLPSSLLINYVRIFSYEPPRQAFQVPNQYISQFQRADYRWRDDSASGAQGTGPFKLEAPPECCDTGELPDYCHCSGWCSCYSA
jgi:hypothetical protein